MLFSTKLEVIERVSASMSDKCQPVRPRQPRRQISDAHRATGLLLPSRARDVRRVRMARAGRTEVVAVNKEALDERHYVRIGF